MGCAAALPYSLIGGVASGLCAVPPSLRPSLPLARPHTPPRRFRWPSSRRSPSPSSPGSASLSTMPLAALTARVHRVLSVPGTTSACSSPVEGRRSAYPSHVADAHAPPRCGRGVIA